VSYTVLHRDDLPCDGSTYEFVGSQYQDTEVSFIWVDMPPGGVYDFISIPTKKFLSSNKGVYLHHRFHHA